MQSWWTSGRVWNEPASVILGEGASFRADHVIDRHGPHHSPGDRVVSDAFGARQRFPGRVTAVHHAYANVSRLPTLIDKSEQWSARETGES